jgi:hypothetical protein
MRKRRIKLLNNNIFYLIACFSYDSPMIAYHIKLIKEQRYFSKEKLLINVFIIK